MSFNTLQLSKDWLGAPGGVAYWPLELVVQTATSDCGTCAMEHANNRWKQAHRWVGLVWLLFALDALAPVHYVSTLTSYAILIAPIFPFCFRWAPSSTLRSTRRLLPATVPLASSSASGVGIHWRGWQSSKGTRGGCSRWHTALVEIWWLHWEQMRRWGCGNALIQSLLVLLPMQARVAIALLSLSDDYPTHALCVLHHDLAYTTCSTHLSAHPEPPCTSCTVTFELLFSFPVQLW